MPKRPGSLTEQAPLRGLEPRMFCEESLGKIKFWAFPERISPRILSLESVHYFGTSKHFSGRKKRRTILISKTLIIVCKGILWWTCGLFSAMIEMTRGVLITFLSRFLSRPLNFHVIIHTYSLRLQTYFQLSPTHILNQ